MKDVLVIHNQNSFETFFYDRIAEDPRCDVMDEHAFYYDGKNRVLRPLLARLRFHFKVFVTCFDRHKTILVIDNTTIGAALSRFKKNVKVFIWNTVTEAQAKVIPSLKKRCEVSTFDPKDAETYGIRLVTQFHVLEHAEAAEENPPYDITFVGVDKGRGTEMRSLTDVCRSQGLKYDFHVINDASTIFEHGYEDVFTDERMQYRDILEHERQSRAVLDLVKPGQTGLTLRILEALMLNKKIVTNNPLVMKELFYDEQKVFVLGIQPTDGLKSFLEGRTIRYDDAFCKYYLFDAWLTRLLENVES